MKLIKIISSILLFFALLACQVSTNDSIKDDSKVIAVVGEYAVTEQYLQSYLKTKGIKEPSQSELDQAFEEILQFLSLRHQSIQLDKQLPTDQLLAIEQIKHRAQAQLAIDDLLVKNPVSEADIKAEYQKIVNELQGQEYHVHHLLFEDEIQALSILDELSSGQTFTAAETEYLATFDEVKNVGDIGWVNIMQVPEVFRKPLQAMNSQTVYPEPLISQFGVHVLYLENKRSVQPPEFDAVKVGILKTLENQKIDRYKQLAVIKAKIKKH